MSLSRATGGLTQTDCVRFAAQLSTLFLLMLTRPSHSRRPLPIPYNPQMSLTRATGGLTQTDCVRFAAQLSTLFLLNVQGPAGSDAMFGCTSAMTPTSISVYAMLANMQAEAALLSRLSSRCEESVGLCGARVWTDIRRRREVAIRFIRALLVFTLQSAHFARPSVPPPQPTYSVQLAPTHPASTFTRPSFAACPSSLPWQTPSPYAAGTPCPPAQAAPPPSPSNGVGGHPASTQLVQGCA